MCLGELRGIMPLRDEPPPPPLDALLLVEDAPPKRGERFDRSELDDRALLSERGVLKLLLFVL